VGDVRNPLLTIRWLIAFAAVLAAPIAHGAAAPTADARTVTDPLGRRITIPASPQRIVALAPSVTEIIFALGQGHRLSGATRYSDYPEAAHKLPKVGSYVQLDLERIVALNPDLCIAVKDGNPKAVVDRLASLGIPVYAVDPRNLDAVLDAMIAVGDLLGVHDQANALVADLHARIQAVEERRRYLEHPPTVFFQIGIAPIVSVGSDTFIHELVELAGGINLAAGPVPYPRFSREEVMALRPEMIIITSMAREGTFEEARREWARWTHMPATRNNRIYLVDSNLFDRASPRLVEGLENLADILHGVIRRPGP
jgi:iron complex transport system substrate-binding protein